MFFRRAKNDQVAEKAAPPVELAVAVEVPATDVIAEDAGGDPVGARIDPAPELDFSTTEELAARDDWLGQDHVVTAVQSALEIDAPGFNVCIVSPPGFGTRSALRALLSVHSATAPAPGYSVQLHDFAGGREPAVLTLPAARAQALASGLLEALSELTVTIRAALHSEEFNARLRLIDGAYRAAGENALAALQQQAAAQNIALLRTPNGYGLAPMHDGRVVKPGVFAQLPQAMRSDVEARIAILQAELADVLALSPQHARQQRDEVLGLRARHTKRAIASAYSDLVTAFADLAGIAEYLSEVQISLTRNCDLFLTEAGPSEIGGSGPAAIARNPRFQDYLARVVPGEPPLMPQYAAEMFMHGAGTPVYLVDAENVSSGSETYRQLKREVDHLNPTTATPKIVLLADETTYDQLCRSDAGFSVLFKVTVWCAERLERSKVNDNAYACWIAGLARRDKRMHLTGAAVAAIMGDSARRAGAVSELSLSRDAVLDILAEAHHGALQAEDKVIDAGHVQHVFAEQAARLASRHTKLVNA